MGSPRAGLRSRGTLFLNNERTTSKSIEVFSQQYDIVVVIVLKSESIVKS